MSTSHLRQDFLRMSRSTFTIYKYCRETGVPELQARPLSKALKDILKRLEKDKTKDTFTHQDISLILKDAIAKQAYSSNQEHQHLIEQLKLVNEQLAPISNEIENCKEKANTIAQRYAFSFFSILCI